MKTAVYTGKTINIGTAKVTGSTGKVTYTYYSDAKCKYKVSAHKNAGTYYVKATVAEDENYDSATSKAVKLTIKKADNTLTVSPTKKTLKQAKLTTPKSITIKAKKAQGKVYYFSSGAAQKAGIAVYQSGKVVIPKKCKKGTYKIRVYAAGTTNYKAKNLYTVITVQ